MKALVAFVTLSTAAILTAADDIGPNFANSAKARRERELTLLPGPPEPLPAVTVEIQARLLHAHWQAAEARIAAIDARLRVTDVDDPRRQELTAEREAVLKRQNEVGVMLEQLRPAPRKQ